MSILHSPLLEDSVLKDEIALEERAVSDGIRRYWKQAKAAVKRGDGGSLKPAERLIVHWMQPMVTSIAADIRRYKNDGQDIDISYWGEPFAIAGAETVAAVTMHEAIGALMSQPAGVPYATLAYDVGNAVVAEANAKRLKKATTEDEYEIGGETKIVKSNQLKNLRRKYKSLDAQTINWFANQKLEVRIADRRGKMKIGSRLLWTMIAVCEMPNGELTFARKLRGDGKHARAYFVAGDSVIDAIEKGHSLREAMRPRYLPMIVPPYTWTKDAQGGYVKIRNPFVINPSPSHKRALSAANLDLVFECLQAVGASPCRPNAAVLHVAKEASAGGGTWPGIPPKENPPKLTKPENWDELAEDAKRRWKRAAVDRHREIIQCTADRLLVGQQISIAEMFREYPAMYFPQQFDHRSRCYPIPQHLNFHNNDLARGLLELATPKPAESDEAKRNLAIHAANCYGLEKASIAQRVAWADQNGDNIRRCAAEPLTATWWTTAKDKPWQFLAACMAVADPLGAGAHIAIQADGTWNGLQHYAALGLDERGASAVNMTPSSEDLPPANGYADVAKVVVRRLQADALAGNQYAILLDGKVDASVVKPNCMTKLYGVTNHGAAAQILDKLKNAKLPPEHAYRTASYLSKIVLDSIGEVCSKAQEIMDWLWDVATIILTETKQPLQWTTPIGFPVVLPHRREPTIEVATIDGYLQFKPNRENAPAAKGKQRNSFAPGYVHSLDATHMMMVALACRRDGIDFHATHDGYRTHAATKADMLDRTKRCFIDMHTAPLLERLRGEMMKRYAVDLPDAPQRGTFDLENICSNPYFFN